jgi:hypothetical protein
MEHLCEVLRLKSKLSIILSNNILSLLAKKVGDYYVLTLDCGEIELRQER